MKVLFCFVFLKNQFKVEQPELGLVLPTSPHRSGDPMPLLTWGLCPSGSPEELNWLG